VASCSNDDVPTPDNGNPDAQGGTSLTVKFDKAADTTSSQFSMSNGIISPFHSRCIYFSSDNFQFAICILIANYTVPTNLIGETKEEVFTALNKTFDSELEVGGIIGNQSHLFNTSSQFSMSNGIISPFHSRCIYFR